MNLYKKDLTFSKHQLFFNLFFILLIINLVLYQSSYMINNILYIMLTGIVLLGYFISIKRIKKNNIIGLMALFIILFSILNINLDDFLEIKRTLIVIFTYFIYFLVFIFATSIYKKIELGFYRYAYIFFVIPFILISFIFNIDYRGGLVIPNPNWIAIMLMYTYVFLFVLTKDNLNIIKILFSFIILGAFFYFSLESRGTSLMMFSMISLILLGSLVNNIFTKYIFILYFSLGIIGFSIFLNYLYNEPLMKEMLLEITERGMSGREKALFIAHEYLFNDYTGFFGNGAGFSVSYVDEISNKSIRLYFSFYEIVLKFSILFFLLFTLFLNNIWVNLHKLKDKKNKIIMMGIFLSLTMTVFFYGGYAPGLYGINIYNFFLLGLIYSKSMKIILKENFSKKDNLNVIY